MRGSLLVAGEEPGSRVDVGLRACCCVGPREGTKGKGETRHYQHQCLSTGSLSELERKMCDSDHATSSLVL